MNDIQVSLKVLSRWFLCLWKVMIQNMTRVKEASFAHEVSKHMKMGKVRKYYWEREGVLISLESIVRSNKNSSILNLKQKKMAGIFKHQNNVEKLYLEERKETKANGRTRTQRWTYVL